MKKFLQSKPTYYKEYYTKNKDKYAIKIMCVCGKEYTYTNKYKHNLTKHHKVYMDLLEFKLLPKEPDPVLTVATLMEPEVLYPTPNPKD